MNLEITDNARTRVRSLQALHGNPVRLSIESGGCQGFNKVWSLSADVNEDDVLLLDGGLVIDSVSIDLLDGATIDFKTDLSGSYWQVIIPSATSTCGCGTSFSM